MVKKWEVNNEICTFEEMMARIVAMPRPLGIVLGGKDCEPKSKIAGMFLQIGGRRTAWDTYDNAKILAIIMTFEAGKDFIVMLNRSESHDYDTRRQCTYALQTYGARSIIGIYVPATEEAGSGEVAESLDIPKAEEFDMLLVPKCEEG